MPFRKWSVEPIFLCRNSASKPELQLSCKGLELETVVNTSLVKCLRQLSSIVKVADRIFEDVGSECRVVHERIERLRIKIQNCEEAASQLDARSIRVPVCDLSTSFKFLRSHKPYKTVYDQRTQLFLPSSRPPCIDKLYSEAAPTPVSVICAVDGYRTDGYSSSELFMVTPVLGGEATKRKRRRKMMLDIETRKPANFSLARRKQDDQKSGGSENAGDVPSTPVDDLERLPSPEERILAMSMEYPSSLVPVDVSGSSFLRMSQCRRSLIHADFVIRRKKGKGKRRHTVCEGSSKELEKALENVTMVNSSCQTDDLVLPETTSTFFRRSFSRRRARSIDVARRETVALDGLNLDFGKKDTNEQAIQQESGTTKRNVQTAAKKQGRLSLMSRAANPIISLSAVLSNAVRLRHSKSSGVKQDDGRSSSGNWSASSSARASVDSDQHHAALAIDRNSNLSRSSAGKDSLLSDGTQQESVRSQDNAPTTGQVPTLEALSDKARALRNAHPWDYDRGRESSTSTPERSSDCASTPLVISPYICRRNRFNFYGGGSLDDGESSVYSVDTDGYYTSMHTDSGLWNAMNPSGKAGEVLDGIRMRHRRESQSSISTIGNGSVNSILSRTVTENSSETGSLKTQRFAPEPPPRTCTASDSKSHLPSDVTSVETCKAVTDVSENVSSKDNSPMRNGSASESDHEVGDRIRYKTTINSSRYPSMCAVSPETSDDELCELREKSKSPTVSVVVAEVHQVDDFSNHRRTESGRCRRSPSQESETGNRKHFINMYGGHSPSESLFNSSLTDARQTATSTPKKKSSVTSFSPDLASSADTVVSVSPIKQQDSSSQPQIAPRSPLLKPREMTAVPIPSVPRIQITPLKSPSPCPTPASESFPASKQADVGKTASTAGTPPTRPKGFLKNPFRQSTETAVSKSTKSSPPSYVSFQSPDSPVSSSTALSPILVPTVPDTAPAPNVDPVSRIAYASCSLDRNWRNNNGARSIGSSPAAIYATLPKYHSFKGRTKASSPVSDISSVSRNSPGHQAVAKILSDDQENIQPECTVQRPENARTQNLLFRPSRGGRFCRTYFPSHLISPRLLPNPLASATSPPSPSTSVKSESSVSSLSSCNSKTFQEADIGLPPVSGSYPQPPKVTGRIFPSVYSSPSPAFVRGNSSSNSAIRQSPVQFTSCPAVPEKRNVQYSGHHSSECSAGSVYRVPSVYKFRPMVQKYPAPTSYGNGRQQPMLSVSTPTTSHILSHVAREELERNTPDRRVSPGLNETSRDYLRKKPAEFTPPNPPDVIPSSSTPPSTLDITSRTGCRASSSPENQRSNTPVYDQQRLKSLSSSELFAVIHSSKKKHNIKTESEKSLSPLSSRSSSPSVSCAGSPAKSPRVETGFLRQSPKLQDRSCSPSSPSGGLAADRFGRAKPTSMHDFKMLLLQTRAGSQSCSSRPSAAELLKVSPPKSSTTLSQSTNSRVASSLPLSPKTLRLPSPHSNTASSSPVHVPVPMKRGLRTRSPYLTRYDSAYPPIWEDCSEDIEEADENQNTVNTYSCPSPSVKELSSNRYCSPAVSAVLDNERPNRASTWV